MRIIIVMYVVSSILISCTKVEYRKVTNAQDTAVMVKGALIIGDPIDFYNDRLLVFPIGGLHFEQPPLTTDNKAGLNFFKSSMVANQYDRTGTLEYRISDEQSQQVNNLIFYNKQTREKHSLVDSGLHILSFAVHKEFKEHLIFYEIVKTDRNKDSLYTSDDAVQLFISKTDGTGFAQLSPDNEKYLTYFFYPETNTVLVKSAADTNGDKKFTLGEETRFTEVNLNNPAVGKDIFSDDLKKQLRGFIQNK